jgi:hypothetical protein
MSALRTISFHGDHASIINVDTALFPRRFSLMSLLVGEGCFIKVSSNCLSGGINVIQIRGLSG